MILGELTDGRWIRASQRVLDWWKARNPHDADMQKLGALLEGGLRPVDPKDAPFILNVSFYALFQAAAEPALYFICAPERQELVLVSVRVHRTGQPPADRPPRKPRTAVPTFDPIPDLPPPQLRDWLLKEASTALAGYAHGVGVARTMYQKREAEMRRRIAELDAAGGAVGADTPRRQRPDFVRGVAHAVGRIRKLIRLELQTPDGLAAADVLSRLLAQIDAAGLTPASSAGTEADAA